VSATARLDRIQNVSVLNSLSGGDWEMDEVFAMRDPAHTVQIGRDHRAPTAKAAGVWPSNDAWPRVAL